MNKKALGYLTKRFFTQNHSDRNLDRRKEFLRLFRVRIHCLLTGLPVCGTHFIGVRLDVLDGLQHAQRFIYATTEAEVIDGGVLNHPILIYDEQAAKGNACIRVENIVSGADFFLEIGNQWIVDVTDSAAFTIGLDPSEVRKLAIDRDPEDFGVQCFEFSMTIAESRDFGGTYKGEVQWIEEQDHVLAAKTRQFDVFKFLIHNSRCSKVGSRLTHPEAFRHARFLLYNSLTIRITHYIRSKVL